jgi:undecaprenyl-diphosphatase
VIVVAAVKWIWLLGAVGLAGYLLARRRSHSRPTIVAGVLLAAGAAAVGAGLVRLPNLESLILRVGETLGPWTYLLVGALAFLETGAFVGLVAPGETAVIVGGLVAGQGQISLPLLIALVWACAVAGDVTSYVLGRRLGRGFLLRHGQPLKITEERLAQVEGFFDRHGGATILIGRFIGFVRALAPFVAGASRMPLRRFLPYDVLGAGAWGASFCVLGYVFWQSFHQLTTYVSRGLTAFATVVALVIGVWALVRLRRDPQRRERVRAWLAEREERPAWRPLVHAAGPLWRRVLRPAAAGAEGAARFSWDRLTPGHLGLELTTIMALLALGGIAFWAIGDDLGDPGVARADRMAASIARPVRAAGLLDAARIVSALGSLPVAAACVLACAAGVARRRRIADAVGLVLGLALLVGAVHVATAAYGARFDYPAEHAAYAVSLVACAVVLVRAGTGWAVRSAAVTVAVGLVCAVAGARVYLGAEELTEVIGGLGLGVAVWSVVASSAVVAFHVRHNVARTP